MTMPHRLGPGPAIPSQLHRYMQGVVERFVRPTSTVEYTFGTAVGPDGSDRVRHRLGAVPTGFQVVSKTATCDIRMDATKKPDRNFIYLRSSVAGVTVSIEVH